jgi:riboflavin kinase/FMN adenylyltransferase
MQSLFRLADFPAALRGAVVVLGNFDGVHRGHASVLELAKRLGGPLVVLTFEPHPRAVLVPGTAPFRLTSGQAKLDALSEMDVAACLTLTFDRHLAAMPAVAFVEDVLVDGLGASHVVVGHDYAFGKGRSGDTRLLRELGDRHGFGVVAVPPMLGRSGERISSSQIRACLQAGRVREASDLLGREWTIAGRIQAGGRGTASLALGDHLPPGVGSYDVELTVEGGARLYASADREEQVPDRLLLRTGGVELMDGLQTRVTFLDRLDQPRATARQIQSASSIRYQISCG